VTGAIKSLGRTLLICVSGMSLSACLFNGTKKAEKPKSTHSEMKGAEVAYKVNSGLKTPLPPALKAATPPKTPYSPRPNVKPHYLISPASPKASLVASKTPTTSSFNLPPALRLAKPAIKPYAPLPEIIATSSKINGIKNDFRLDLKLAPKTITEKTPLLKKAGFPSQAVVHVDPSITKKGHFSRSILPYDTLKHPTAEPIRSDIETFRQAIASSYKNDPRLKAERIRVKETDEGYIQARALGRLNAQATSDVSYEAQYVPIQGNLTWQKDIPRNTQLLLTQPLYQGGRVKALKKQAKADIIAAREALRNSEQSTALSAATAFADVVRDRDIAKIRRNDLRLVLKQKQAAKDRYEIGIGTQTDIFQADSRVADAEITLARSQAQLAISYARYDRVVGHPPLQLSTIPELNIPKTLNDAKLISKRNNPRLRSLAKTFDSAFYNIDAAKAAGRPTLFLTGTAAAERGQQVGLSRRDDATIALQLRVPIYSGGLNQSTLRQAKLGKDRLYYEVLDTERAIDETLSDIWSDYEAGLKNLQENQIQLAAAQNAYEGVREEQILGQRTLLDVLDAERELQQTKANLVTIKRNLDVAKFELLTIMGVFDARHLALPVAIYDPSKNLNAISQSKYSARRAKNIIKDWINPNPPDGLAPAWP